MKNASGKAASCRLVPPLSSAPSRLSRSFPHARALGLFLVVGLGILLLSTPWVPQGWAKVLPHAASSVAGGGDEPPWHLQSDCSDPVFAPEVTVPTNSKSAPCAPVSAGVGVATAGERRPAGIPEAPAESALARIARTIRLWFLVRP